MVRVKLLTVRKSTSSGSEFHTLTIRSEKSVVELTAERQLKHCRFGHPVGLTNPRLKSGCFSTSAFYFYFSAE